MITYVTVKKMSELTGYSEKSLYNKMYSTWTEGRQYIHAPDGKPLIHIGEFEQWVQSTQECEQKAKRLSRSTFTTKAKGLGSASQRSPQPLI